MQPIFKTDGTLVPYVDYNHPEVLNSYWMDYDDYSSLEEVFCQRDTESRINRARKHLSTCRAEHAVVFVCRLNDDAELHGKKYKAGHRFRVDSNTRAMIWSQGGSDKVPSKLLVIEFCYNNLDEIRECYNTFDSPDSVERNQEKLYGVLAGMYHFDPVSEKLRRGQIISALNKASHFYFPDTWSQTNVKPSELPGQVGAFIDEIKHFDKYCKTASSWDQALVCSALMAIKKYGTENDRLNEALTYINDRAGDTRGKDWDGVTHIVEEWKIHKFFPAKATQWDTLNRTVSFCCYWLDKYIEDEKGSKVGHGWDKVAFKYKDQIVKYKSKLNFNP